MSIASEITRIQGNVSDSYTAVSNKGGTLPATQNSDNLATAIASIPTASAPVINSLNVTPSTSAQTITATGGVDGYSPVNVSAVTNSIDANITAGNIKNGVTILGVTGTYASSVGIEFEVNQNGEMVPSTTASTIIDFTGATKIALQGLFQYAYYKNQSISGTVDMSDIVTISGGNACSDMFGYCHNITGANLSSLTTVSGSYACAYMFQESGIASLDVSSLETIGGFSCYYMCSGCTNLMNVVFSSLTTVGNYGLNRAFYRCNNISLSFPAITTTSSIVLAGICEAASNVTLHFPSNVQSLIEGLTGYSTTAPFGAVSGTVLFDLPATS